MQLQNKKQTKLVPIKPHFSALRKGQRNSSSLSALKGRKYFKTTEKKRINKEDEFQTIGVQNTKQIIVAQNDYGFNKRASKYPIEASEKKNDTKNENIPKKDQPKVDNNNMKFTKINRFKQSIRSSKKSHSYDSILKIRSSKTPNKKSFLRTADKVIEPPSPEMTVDTKDYEKTIKILERQNQYYQGLYANSQQRIEALKKSAEDEKKKYQRVKQIYQQKLNKLNYNKQICQKNLGHIFSYECYPKDIVPAEVIVENSLQSSIEDISRTSRKNSEFNCSKISTLSINSR